MATLQERIKEEIVLRRGQVKERHWRQTGLPDEAAREGIAADEFRRLVNELSRQINFEKLADLRRRLEDALSAPPLYQLHQTQADDFVAEAERMGLSGAFVRDRWIPQLIADLKKAAPVVVEPVATPSAPAQPVVPEPQPVIPAPSPTTPPPTATRERIKAILDEYDGHITARELRLLFRALPADEQTLAEEVLAYLSANFYASETEPRGATLREKLLSTDWRHLSWWDKAPAEEPVRETVLPIMPPYASEPANPYVPPVPPNAQTYSQPPPSQPPRPSRSNAGLWGGLFAVAVLLILYFLIKPNGRKRSSERDPDRTEQTTPPGERAKTIEKESEPAKEEPTGATQEDEESTVTDDRSSQPEPVTEESAPEQKPVEETNVPAKKYDRILETAGQFGEYQARLGRKWGLWRDNDWMIYPIYDDITLFKDGRATVVRSGRTYEIDEKGNPIEE